MKAPEGYAPLFCGCGTREPDGCSCERPVCEICQEDTASFVAQDGMFACRSCAGAEKNPAQSPEPPG